LFAQLTDVMLDDVASAEKIVNDDHLVLKLPSFPDSGSNISKFIIVYVVNYFPQSCCCWYIIQTL